ncbi:hypothetical protein ACFQ3W_06765 [Paenibacillus puldeungensis]|uniref:YhfM-like domain-containing protein n=1 Tax=Paenibacillus puldeungensis TaxID=696536 RepID=A0ABW3RV92_9BACL
MNKILAILIFLALLLTGCQKNTSDHDTWGNKHNINTGDISEIVIQNVKGTDVILPQKEIISFMKAINGGRYNIGKLDIRPPDYSVKITLKNGKTRGLSIWGADLFVDHDDNGHYQFVLSENERTKVTDILNKAESVEK